MGTTVEKSLLPRDSLRVSVSVLYDGQSFTFTGVEIHDHVEDRTVAIYAAEAGLTHATLPGALRTASVRATVIFEDLVGPF